MASYFLAEYLRNHHNFQILFYQSTAFKVLYMAIFFLF